MRPDTVREWIRRTPFRAFRLHLTNGVSFDIRHPEQAAVLRDRVVLGGGEPSATGPSRLIDVALLHINYIEAIPASPLPSRN
jgi:hypothetical protein